MTKAYSYVRFSTPEQALGESRRRQGAFAEAYAAANGLVLDERLTDAGLSAFHSVHRSKGALGMFIAAVEAGTVSKGSVLIVESLDRLSRDNVLVALSQFINLIQAGIEVVTATDGQRYSLDSIEKDWTRLLMSLTIMARAHEESATKSFRVTDAWDKKKIRAVGGEAMTSRCVAWCRVEGVRSNARYVLIPERAAIVERIFQQSANGYGQRLIANRLNREEVPVWGGGDGWHASYVTKILGNRAVIGFCQPYKRIGGKRVPDGSEITGHFPPAVDEALFWRALAARAERRGKGGRKGQGVANLFSGISRCDGCKGPMVYIDKGKLPKGGQYLVCDRNRRGLFCELPARWHYSRAEGVILRGLQYLDLSGVLGQPDPMSDFAEKAQRLRDQLAAAEGLRDRLVAALGDVQDGAIIARIRAAAADVARLVGESSAADAEAKMMSASYVSLADRLSDIAVLTSKMASTDPENVFELRVRLAKEVRRAVRQLRFRPENILADYGGVGADEETRFGWAATRWTLGIPLIDDREDVDMPGEDIDADLNRMGKAATFDLDS